MLSLKRLLLISRPVSYLPTAAICAAGLAGSHGNWPLSGIWTTLYFTFPFGLIAYGINDIADRESDAKNKRKGGIDGAALKTTEVDGLMRWIITISLLFPLLFILSGHLLTAALVGGLSVLSWAYSMRPVRLKSVPVLDSASNAIGILLIYLAGYLWSSGFTGASLPAAPLMAAIILFAASVHAMGAVADREVDMVAGDRTIGTTLGKTATLLLCAGFFAACFELVGRNHLITGLYLVCCALLTLAATRVRQQRFVRNVGFFIIVAFPFAILPSVL